MIMATDKRFAFTQSQDKEFAPASVTVQLPTTSANNHRIQNTVSSITNYCHHQAATRSLLHRDNNATISSNSSTTSGIVSNADSDESPTPPPNYYEIPGIVPAYQGRTSGPPPSYDDVVNPNAQPPSYQSLFGQVQEARKTSNGLVDLFRQLFLILIGTLGCTMIIGFLLLIPITMILIGTVYVNECRAENIPSFLVIGGLVWIVKNILNCYNQFKKDSSTVNRPPPRRAPISTNSSNRTNFTQNTSSANILIVQNQTQINSTSDRNNNNSSLLTMPSHTDMASAQSVIQTDSSSASSSLSSSSSSSTTTTATTRPRESQSVARIRQPSLIGITSFKCESMLNYFLIVWFLAGCIVVYRIYEPDYENPLSSSYCNRTVYLYAFWLITSAFIIMAIILSCLCCLMASSLISCNHGR